MRRSFLEVRKCPDSCRLVIFKKLHFGKVESEIEKIFVAIMQLICWYKQGHFIGLVLNKCIVFNVNIDLVHILKGCSNIEFTTNGQ